MTANRIPVIGKNPPYVMTFAIFVLLTIPSALTESFAGLLVLRFLLGFFGEHFDSIPKTSLLTYLGSPCLATCGASFQDMVTVQRSPNRAII